MSEKHTREIVNLKEKYEAMIAELKANAKNDKEFLKMELEKKIRDLEQEIERLQAQFGKDKEALMGEQMKIIRDLEEQIKKMKEEH